MDLLDEESKTLLRQQFTTVHDYVRQLGDHLAKQRLWIRKMELETDTCLAEAKKREQVLVKLFIEAKGQVKRLKKLEQLDQGSGWHLISPECQKCNRELSQKDIRIERKRERDFDRDRP